MSSQVRKSERPKYESRPSMSERLRQAESIAERLRKAHPRAKIEIVPKLASLPWGSETVYEIKSDISVRAPLPR